MKEINIMRPFGGYNMKIPARIFLLAVLTIAAFSSCSTLTLAEMAAKKGDHKAIIKYYTRYLEELGGFENDPYHAFHAYRERAWAYLITGEPEKARADYEIVIQDNPDFMYKDEMFHTYVSPSAFKAWKMGNYNEAIDEAPYYANAYESRAFYYKESGKYDQAEEDFKKALLYYSEKGLEVVSAYAGLIATYQKKNEFDKAIKYYNRAVQMVPDNGYWYGYGHLVSETRERIKNLAANLTDDLLNIADDKADAKYWSARAEQGEARAQHQLGVHYENGTGGVKKDMAKAVSWYAKSAASGYDPAQHNLALCYLDGKGVSKDAKKAFEWFVKAAEQGHAKAQYNVGVCYYFGEGTTENANKAAYWFAKSAEQRNPEAQFNLAMLYLNGEGVPEDMTKALFWFNQGARNDHAKAREGRDALIEMGYALPRNSEQDMLARGYTKAGEGVYSTVLYKPFDDLKAGTIAADDSCIFISKAYVESNFRSDTNTWFKIMDQKYAGNGAGVISNEPGKQKIFTMIFNDRTFIPKIGDTVYIGWRIDDTANVQTSNDAEKIGFLAVSASNGFSGILFESVPVALAASYSESEVLEKVRTRIKR
jgi:tetratricopeptide (TPR) repeat protein